MLIIHARNVHQALPQGIALLDYWGEKKESRNGEVIVAPVPVTTYYENPTERVVLWPERDANPFFHFFEALWMLDGRNDVDFPARFVERMRSFSDNGETFHGAYGFRWRRHHKADQLRVIAKRLRMDPQDRRCVLQIWSSSSDLDTDSKDIPCNTQVYFWRGFEGQLHMTVTNRSNDIIWGAYGANAVHFSFLQEFMAAWIGCPVGHYWQVSNNFHAYPKTVAPVAKLANEPCSWAWLPGAPRCPYSAGAVKPYPLVKGDALLWLGELKVFLQEGPTPGLKDPFFRRVAGPLWLAHEAYKSGDMSVALGHVERCEATDWKVACAEWLQRRILARKAREERRAHAEDDGVSYEE